MNILITGATGFIGKHVLSSLLMGSMNHNIVAIARYSKNNYSGNSSNVKNIIVSLDKIDEIKQEIIDFAPDICIHLAWSGIPNYSAEISKYNLDISLNLIDLLLENTQCKRIIMSGSCLEYGKTLGECIESDPAQVNSFFTWAKNSIYQYASLRCEERSADLYWLRFFYVYGPGQRKETIIPTIIDAFKNSKTPSIKAPYNSNDYIHVKDIARAIAHIIDKIPEPGIYNLGSGKATSVIELCEIIERKICNSTDFTDNLRRLGRPKKEVSFWANSTKAKSSFGWEPRFTLIEGIGESYCG